MMYRNGILNKSIYGIIVAVLATFADATAANVVPRPSSTTAKASASRPTSAASRMPTMSVKTGSGSSSKGTSTSNSSSTSNSTSSSSTTTTTTTTTSSSSQQTQKKEEFVADTSKVENKSSQFSTTLSSQSSSELDSSATTLAELVRIQRAALDAADTVSAAKVMATDLSGTGENACDSMLRECMIQKCGSNFGKCVADTDTTFFDKMDTCRRTTNCTGHEYQLLSAEIKADRDLNAKLAVYNATIDCGNNYDTCIIAQCGATYSKCIGKSAGDEAIRKCENIAKSCIEYDSGLAMRTMSVFGEVRQNAERQIATDERRLYDLREQMRSVCTRLGAMFDERSLDCVYTVNFYANGDSTLYASKKAYAGSTFDCTQNWFGIDITTFRENAFRATRAQTAASSAMLGSGLGQAVGALTSGAIDRAIDRYKAEKDYEAGLKECMEDGDMTEEECLARSCTNFDDEKPAAGLVKECMPAKGTTKSGFSYDYTTGARGYDDEVECERYMGVWNKSTQTCDCGTCRVWNGGTYASCVSLTTLDKDGEPGEESLFERLWCDQDNGGATTSLDLFKGDLQQAGLWKDKYDSAKGGTTDDKKDDKTNFNAQKSFSKLSDQANRVSNSLHANGLKEICEGSKNGVKGIWSESQNTCLCPDTRTQHFDKEYGCISFDRNFTIGESASAPVEESAAALASECMEDRKWYSLPRSAFAGPNEPVPYSYLAYGFHQLSNQSDPEIKEVLSVLEKKCRDSGGVFYNQEHSLQEVNIRNVCNTYNKYQRVMCLYNKDISRTKQCENGTFKHASVTVEYANDPSKQAPSSGYNACNFKYKNSRPVASVESFGAGVDMNDTDLFTTIMNKLQANDINVTDSTEREKIRLFVESSINKDNNVGPGYPAVENSPSATGIKYYLHLDYPKLKNSTANEHGAFCLDLDKSICSGPNSTCEVTYTGQSKCTFAYRLLQ